MVQGRHIDGVTTDDSALPLVVAVTGHRDLVDAEVAAIRERVQCFLAGLGKRYPDRRLQVMSSLAEGADQLVAEIAVNLGVELVVPLPMRKDLYLQDFQSAPARARFESLCGQASEVYELPLAKGNTVDMISRPGLARSREYAQVGVFLSAHCHILLALWDGKPGTEIGGTGQVVKFHHDDIMPGYTAKTVATQQMLVDDESDLVYHIVCSRDRPDGAPHPAFKPLQCFWFTKDRDHPRSSDIPHQHQVIFERSSEFSRDAIEFSGQIREQSWSLLDNSSRSFLPKGIGDIDRIFGMADWLAIHFQKKTLRTLQISHVLAFLMGLMFILYSDYQIWPFYMYAFLLFFLVAAAIQHFAKRLAWNRKYLDYRALAEGLRVQFYWAAAGVTNENESKFTHDNFLQTQDPELGWIRNVMRVAGTECDASPKASAEGLQFVLKEWIGDDHSGQLGYYRKKARERVRKSIYTDRLGLVSLLTSVVVVLLFLVAGTDIPEPFRDPIMLVIGSFMVILLLGVFFSVFSV
jgi:hypothetical protein